MEIKKRHFTVNVYGNRVEVHPRTFASLVRQGKMVKAMFEMQVKGGLVQYELILVPPSLRPAAVELARKLQTYVTACIDIQTPIQEILVEFFTAWDGRI